MSVQSCPRGELGVRLVETDAGAGSRFVRIGLVHARGAAPCSLSGYPGVVLLAADGRPVPGMRVEQVAGPTSAPAEPPPRVTLAPGAEAAFVVTYTVVEGEPGGCRDGTALRVSPPGDSVAVGTIQVPVRACGARLRVTPVMDATGTG